MSFLLAACCLIQLAAAYQEIFTWEAFSDKLLGLPTLLEQRGIDPGTQSDLMTMTGQLGMNQGLYNIFLAAGMVPAMIYGFTGGSATLAIFSLLCMAVAGIFGALTVPSPDGSNRNLITFGIQAIPPIVTLIVACFAT